MSGLASRASVARSAAVSSRPFQSSMPASPRLADCMPEGPDGTAAGMAGAGDA